MWLLIFSLFFSATGGWRIGDVIALILLGIAIIGTMIEIRLNARTINRSGDR